MSREHYSRNSYDHSRRHRDYYGEDRIKKRHDIMEKGVPSIWGDSPKQESQDSRRLDQRRHKEKSSSHKKHKSHRKDSKHKRHKKTSRHASPSSSSESSESISSSLSHSSSAQSDNEPQIQAQIEAPVARKKPTNHIEFLNQREEEEYMNQLKKKHELSKKDDSQGLSGSGLSAALDPKDFGKALLPGEGAAMAAFVADGRRIPRRGEIGLTSEEIEGYERQGYVMSGSRHRRMEAVRLRKESQIYSADEKRALANLDREERAKKNQRTNSYLMQLIEAKTLGSNR